MDTTQDPVTVTVMKTTQVGKTESVPMIVNGDVPLQQIGSSGYFVDTDAEGYQRIVVAENVGKTSGDLVLARLQVARHNAELARSKSPGNLPRPAVNRQLAAGYAIIEALKAKGYHPGTRVFRQLYRKALKKTGVVK